VSRNVRKIYSNDKKNIWTKEGMDGGFGCVMRSFVI
jgi:hypothetical protein